MPPKRKASAAAAQKIARTRGSPTDEERDPISLPVSRSKPSTRRAKNKPAMNRAADLEQSAKAGVSTGKSKSKEKDGTVVAQVEEAIERLGHLEDKFRSSVKRQKLAVKSSTGSNFDETQSAGPVPSSRLGDISSEPLRISKTRRRKEALPSPDPEETYEEKEEPGSPGDPLEKPVPEESDPLTLKLEGARPPPVNSGYLPLPWKGRIGYACLNTYLRECKPPVFSSRTCRIASIIEHRHPLQDPSQPEHATKNRPDRNKPADVKLGKRYVEELGLANARDIVKMVRWNDKYHIKFMRLSSEMFPFASHEAYGYKLAPFASETLAQAGRVAAELGHRLTTHPGQFTQLGSPRKEVVANAVRDLDYHDELLTLLRLPEQQNRDAVMILHMGGVFGDRAATLDRFRENYAKLSPSVKARLVLENDDVSWSVHDLLPICEELNIPMVLDFHHHNIIFDQSQVREGTKDIMGLFPRIKATWDRKGIKQKMHYSEPCAGAITGRQRRKHSPRVMTLPPCDPDMDLMIEAKDKEQAVFNLMRNLRLPGWETINDIIPFERDDDNRPLPKIPKKPKKTPRKKKNADEDDDELDGAMEVDEAPPTKAEIPEVDIGMGGIDNRVYWPEGVDEWLRPKKREVKAKKQKTEDEAEE